MRRKLLSFPLSILATAALTVASAAQTQNLPASGGKSPPASNVFKLSPEEGLPPLGPAHALIFPTFYQSILSNGLRVVVLEDHRQPLLYVGFSGQAGAIRDPPGKAGLAYLAVQLLQAGSISQDADQIANHVDSLGANMEDDASADFCSLSLNGLSTHADEFCEILSDITTRPKFADRDVDGEKNGILGALQTELGDPSTLASAALARVVYGEHPYGNYAHGTVETLSRVTPEDVRAFYAANYTPMSTILVFQGDITPAHALAIAGKYFGGWTMNTNAPPTAASLVPLPVAVRGTKPTITILDRPGAEQTEVRIGVLTQGRESPERYTDLVASAVLGIGQSDSRLMREIRSKRGLAYGVASTFDVNRAAGVFSIRAATKNESTGEVVRLALAEVRDLASTPPAAAELADRKTLISGDFAINAASPGFLRRAVIYGGPAYLAHIIPAINAVTAPEVSKVMASLQIDSAQIVLVGDAKVILPQVSDLGTVTVIEPDQLDLMSPTLRRAGGAL